MTGRDASPPPITPERCPSSNRCEALDSAAQSRLADHQPAWPTDDCKISIGGSTPAAASIDYPPSALCRRRRSMFAYGRSRRPANSHFLRAGTTRTCPAGWDGPGDRRRVGDGRRMPAGCALSVSVQVPAGSIEQGDGVAADPGSKDVAEVGKE